MIETSRPQTRSSIRLMAEIAIAICASAVVAAGIAVAHAGALLAWGGRSRSGQFVARCGLSLAFRANRAAAAALGLDLAGLDPSERSPGQEPAKPGP